MPSAKDSRPSAGLAIWVVTACVLAATALALSPVQTRADKADAAGKARPPGEQKSDAAAKYEDQVDAAVGKALKFLAGKQLPDGSFHCQMRGNTGVTGLSVMAFLAKGHTPSPGAGPYAKVIDRGIDYVLGSQNAAGLLVSKYKGGISRGPMYSHGVATLMLSEVSGMVEPKRQERIDKALPKALKVILDAQKINKGPPHAGGWRYQHNSGDSDISCTGWQLMALRSARNNGAPVPKEAIEKAVQYVLGLRCPDGGFGYQSAGDPGLARTGTALLCLELCGKHGEEPSTKAGDWVLKHMPKKFAGPYFYYALYYCSQGMFQLGGRHWKNWSDWLYKAALKHQRPDGSWPVVPGAAAKAGPCYATAMAVLSIGVSYRQLPIYQR